MKKIFSILLLVLACLLLFAACDGGDGGDDTTTTTQDNGESTPPPAGPLTLVNADKSINYSVVIPDSVSQEIRSAVISFIDQMKTETDANAKMPLVLDGTAPTNDLEITVNVTKNRPEAAASFYATPYISAKIEIVGNRIVVSAYTVESLTDAFKDLRNSLTKNEDGSVTLARDYAYNLTSTIERTQSQFRGDGAAERWAEWQAYEQAILGLPSFTSAGARVNVLYSLDTYGYAIAFSNATFEQFVGYRAALDAAGFTRYTENVMSAGSKNTDNRNYYDTYTRDDITLSLVWQGNLKVAKIVMTLPSDPLPSLEEKPAGASDTVIPTVTQVHISGGGKQNGGGGMSYVAQMADGKFIVIDGGVPSNFSSDILKEYLETKATEAGMEHPVIAMWLFTHPHADHIGLVKGTNREKAFLQIAKENGYEIESFAYNFADDDANVPNDDETGNIMAFEVVMERYYPDAVVYTPRAGQIYHFTGMQMEILTTEEDVYPLLSQSTHNGFCVNFRMKFDDGKTFMFLADSTPGVLKQMSDLYGDYLKSDVLQMAHHGLTGAEINCYQNIDPDVCLWPTTYERFSGLYAESEDVGIRGTYQYTLGAAYQDGDELGNPTKYGSSQSCIANRWIRGIGEGASQKDRDHYHISQTTIVNAKDLSVTVDDSHKEVWE